jgi:hypothetical protein
VSFNITNHKALFIDYTFLKMDFPSLLIVVTFMDTFIVIGIVTDGYMEKRNFPHLKAEISTIHYGINTVKDKLNIK